MEESKGGLCEGMSNGDHMLHEHGFLRRVFQDSVVIDEEPYLMTGQQKQHRNHATGK